MDIIVFNVQGIENLETEKILFDYFQKIENFKHWSEIEFNAWGLFNYNYKQKSSYLKVCKGVKFSLKNEYILFDLFFQMMDDRKPETFIYFDWNHRFWCPVIQITNDNISVNVHDDLQISKINLKFILMILRKCYQ